MLHDDCHLIYVLGSTLLEMMKYGKIYILNMHPTLDIGCTFTTLLLEISMLCL